MGVRSIWEETSCISLLECMAGGLYCITTNLGALFETGAEFLYMFHTQITIRVYLKNLHK